MTSISLTPQADDLAAMEAVESLLKAEFGTSNLARDPARIDPGFWPRAGELGWIAAALPEHQGGAGFDLAQEMLINREYGRFIAPISLLSTSLAARIFAQKSEGVPPAILQGGEHAGFAAFISERDLCSGSPKGGVHLVAAEANYFLLADSTGAAVFPRDAVTGLKDVEGIDPTATLAQGRLTGAPASWVEVDQEAIALRMQLLLAAQLTGIALAASDMAVEYAKIRVQFGKPIGAFQAVAHLCVDSAVRARAADAQVAVAAIALRDGWPDAGKQVMAASHVASEAAFLAGTNNIQVHGGMGYSAESGAHLFLKRAVLLRRLLPLKAVASSILLGDV